MIALILITIIISMIIVTYLQYKINKDDDEDNTN